MKKTIKLINVSPPSIEKSTMYDDYCASPNNFSYWYPAIKGIKGLSVPKSKILPIPKDVFWVLFEPHLTGNMVLIKNYVDSVLIPAMGNDRWFMKNGTFSNKFSFKHCITYQDKVLDDFIQINYSAMMLGAWGACEMVLREVIPWDRETTATMYEGMPLRPELRVFYDFDARKVLYSVNYWDYEYVAKGLYERTDKIVFEAVHMELEEGFVKNKDRVEYTVHEAMQDVALNGRWSIDVLLEGERMWLIDMAIAERSAYWKPGLAQKGEN